MSSPGELYNDLVNAIIRPPRAAYHDNDLGPVEFTYGGTLFIREDLRLINKRGLAVMCSFWHRRFQPRSVQAGNTPCVVYCHGNASCRVEALTVMGSVLASGFSLFSFDFSGCGHSEGDYISLGWFEQDDVALALEYLKRTRGISTIILWGRSMGAASCLLAASRDSSIAALVLDSPFASFKQLALETSSLVWSMVDWAGLWEAVWKARIGFGGSRREAAAERQRQQSRQLYQLLQEDGNNQASKRDDDGAMSTMSGMTSMTSRRDHVDFERAMAKEGNGPRGGFGVGGFGVQGTGVIRSSRIAEEPEEEGDGEGGEGEGGDGEGGGGPSAAAAPPPVVAASSGGGNILNRPAAAADESEPPKKAKPFLMRTVLRVVATSVRARAKFNLYKLNPAAAGKSCAMPMLIGHAEGDQVIPLHHATIVFDEYGTSAGAKLRAAVAANGRRGVQKRQVVFAGDHNDERPAHFFETATTFLKETLAVSDELRLKTEALPRGSDGHLAPIQQFFDKLSLMQVRDGVPVTTSP